MIEGIENAYVDPCDINGKSVVVDVDGVLFEYDKWVAIDHYGDPINSMIELVNDLYEAGYNILIWTTRTNPRINKGWTHLELLNMLVAKLNEIGLHYTGVIREPKPFFVCLIDDLSWNPIKKQLSDMIKELRTPDEEM